MLERILKPIAYTEQAAAVAGRGREAIAASDDDYRAVVAGGRAYSGIDYMEAGFRRNALRASFLSLFEKGRCAGYADRCDHGVPRRYAGHRPDRTGLPSIGT